MPKKIDGVEYYTKEELDKKLSEQEPKKKAETPEEIDAALKLLQIEKDIAEARGQSYDAALRAKEQYELIKELSEKAFQSEDETVGLLKDKHNLNEQEINSLKERGELSLKLYALENSYSLEQIKSLKEQSAIIDEMSEKKLKKYTEGFTGIGEKLGILSSRANKFVDSATGVISELKNGNNEVQASFQQAFSAQNIAIGIMALVVGQTLKLATAVDKASAAFAANTGAGRIMTSQIMEVGTSFRNLGLGAEDAGKAATTLFSSFRGFSQQNIATQKSLMLTVAGLEKIGVSGEEAGGVINFFNINLGKSGTEAANLTRKLAMTGKSIGMTTKQMVSGYKAALKSLAVYGQGSVEVFQDMAAQAKAAGVEISSLLGLAEKFDTFSGAAEAAGKLNAILGTQLSATELLTMKENERIETLISSIQAQGVAFSQLDRFTQKSIAAAAGISDINEAQKIFGMNLGQYRRFANNAEAAQKSQEEFNQRMKDAMDIMKKLQMIAANFAVQLAPLVDLVATGAQKLLDFSQALRGWPALLVGGAVGIMLMAKAMVFIFPFLSNFPLIAAATGTGLKGLEKSAAATSKGLGAAGIKMAPFAGVVLAIGAAVGIAGYGMSFLVEQLVSLLAEAAKAPMAFLKMAAGIAALGASLSIIGNPLALLGIGSLLGLLTGLKLVLGVDFESMDNALNTMASAAADIKPIIGDLALMTVGATTQDINTNNVASTLNQFSATLENVFKPEVKVFIGDTEIEQIVESVVATQALKA